MPRIEFKQVTVQYSDVAAVRNLSLEIRDGEFFVLLGPSGAGKSSILHVLTGRIRPAKGEVMLDGRIICSPTEFVLPRDRRISAVFQDGGVWPHMTVMEHLLFVLEGRAKKSEVSARAHSALEMVRLAGKESRRPGELSGGERQRLALARSLVVENKVLVLDEPFANLDRPLALDLIADISRLHRSLGLTTLLVTHQQEEALILADRIGLMIEGTMVEVDIPYRVFSSPHDIRAANFFGDNNVLRGEVRNGSIVSALGTVDAPKGARDGARALICIRPSAITATRDGNGVEVHLVSTIYKGEYWLGRTTLEGGEQLLVNLGSRPPEPGAYRVRLTGDYSIILE
ncbi:MAG: ABC transporter ATP-binding protein [Candidatus Brocadiia bacterium]